MKLYVVYGSPNCRKTQAVVNFLGLNVEIIGLDFAGGELKKPEFLSINPNAKTPALQDGSFKLWESNAIMQYLCSKTPDNKLFPDDAVVRADIVRWQFWELAHFSRAAGTFLFENVLKPRLMNKQPDAGRLQEAANLFHSFAPVLDQQLESRRFVIGDDITLADFSLGSTLGFAAAASIPWDSFENIQAWYQRLDQMPAWKSCAPPPGIAT